jgi:hypothetical protein
LLYSTGTGIFDQSEQSDTGTVNRLVGHKIFEQIVLDPSFANTSLPVPVICNGRNVQMKCTNGAYLNFFAFFDALIKRLFINRFN